MKLSLNASKATPVLDGNEKPAALNKTKKENAAASSTGDPPKANRKTKAKNDAASVLPTPSPKAHADKKSKKGKRRARKARVGVKVDHRHQLTRRRRSFAITSSTEEDVAKVTNASTVSPRKSLMPR